MVKLSSSSIKIHNYLKINSKIKCKQFAEQKLSHYYIQVEHSTCDPQIFKLTFTNSQKKIYSINFVCPIRFTYMYFFEREIYILIEWTSDFYKLKIHFKFVCIYIFKKNKKKKYGTCFEYNSTTGVEEFIWTNI